MKESIDDYIERCWGSAKQYVYGVESGLIVTNKWIKLAIERHARDVADPRYEMRIDKVEQVFKFFYFVNINQNNVYSRFRLLPFQAFILVAMFGLHHAGTDRRKYRYSFLFFGRKNGKTQFAAALQLYFLLADGVEDPQSLLVSNSRESASIALEAANNMINNSPALRKRLEPQRYRIVFRDRSKGGFCKTLPANADKQDGWGGSGILLDEIHSYPDDSLFNVMKSSILARDNPMIILISTAGFNTDGFAADMVQTGKNVLNAEVENEAFFYMLYTIDEDDDPNDSSCWIKANPALHEIIHMEDMITEYQQAVLLPNEFNNFLTKHLNVFVGSKDSWVRREDVLPLFRKMDISKYKGQECYLGMDLSSTRDLSSLVALFWDDEINRFVAFSWFFMPDNPAKMLRKGGYNINHWVDEGYIKKSSTKTTDYNAIFEVLKMFTEEFYVVSLMYDQWNAAALVNKLQEHANIDLQPFSQTTQEFNRPMKHLEEMIFNEGIVFDTNPVMLWNLTNTVPFMDGNGNIKPMKNKSLDSIDGVVSLCMALGGHLKSPL